MHRQLVTRTQYLAELNKRLRDHQNYVCGMQFVIREDQDTETAAGFDWVTANAEVAPPTPFADVAAEVHALYRVENL